MKYYDKVFINKVLDEYKNTTDNVSEIAKRNKIGERTITTWVSKYLKKDQMRKAIIENRVQEGDIKVMSNLSKLETDVLAFFKKKRGVHVSFEELSNTFNIGMRQIKETCDGLISKGYALSINDNSGNIAADSSIQSGGSMALDLGKLHGKEFEFGVIADTHLCSVYAREDILNTAYMDFKQRGIKDVFHCGNIIDGEFKFNVGDLKVLPGVENQVEYLIDTYPEVDGINTHYITGSCHEGWYFNKSQLNIGQFIEDKFIRAGRSDMHYIGHIEADVHLKGGSGESVMRLAHPGGGSAYAVSYQPQKIVESLQGGAKPHILLIGHYHKQGYFLARNVNTILVPSMQTQTPFSRKHHITSEIGYIILKIRLDDKGGVSSVIPEFKLFYDDGYYDSSWYFRAFEKTNTMVI